MDKTIDTLIDMAGRWESLDPSKGLKDTEKFIRQGQKDIQFLLNMIEAHAAQIDQLTAENDDLTRQVMELDGGI